MDWRFSLLDQLSMDKSMIPTFLILHHCDIAQATAMRVLAEAPWKSRELDVKSKFVSFTNHVGESPEARESLQIQVVETIMRFVSDCKGSAIPLILMEGNLGNAGRGPLEMNTTIFKSFPSIPFTLFHNSPEYFENYINQLTEQNIRNVAGEMEKPSPSTRAESLQLMESLLRRMTARSPQVITKPEAAAEYERRREAEDREREERLRRESEERRIRDEMLQRNMEQQNKQVVSLGPPQGPIPPGSKR